MKNKICSPEDVALKTFFLGPQAENGPWLMSVILNCLERWFEWRGSLYPQDGNVISSSDRNIKQFINNRKKLNYLAHNLMDRFEKEIPKFSPRYIGHMFSETSLPALLGHFITLLHNPNNVSSDASRVGIELEKEAIKLLTKVVGFDSKKCVGHFTSGGTIANFEAVTRARAKLGYKNAIMLVPSNMHYSWQKAALMFCGDKKYLWPVELDSDGRMSIIDLKNKIELAHRKKYPVLMVVSIAGSTELGSVDPIDKIANLLEGYKKKGVSIWHHVDAAYGGFLGSLKNSRGALDLHSVKAFKAIKKVNSITIDPHKLGYVPYASGAFLVANKKDYFMHSISAPYIAFKTKSEYGPQTIEGSRSAAGAVATWMTLKGLEQAGYSKILARTIKNKNKLTAMLNKSIPQIRIVPTSDTNIICFCVARRGEKTSVTNKRTLGIYKAFSPEQNGEFIVSKTTLAWASYGEFLKKFTKNWQANQNSEELVLIRLTMMNPFFDTKESNVNYAVEFVKALLRQIEK